METPTEETKPVEETAESAAAEEVKSDAPEGESKPAGE